MTPQISGDEEPRGFRIAPTHFVRVALPPRKPMPPGKPDWHPGAAWATNSPATQSSAS